MQGGDGGCRGCGATGAGSARGSPGLGPAAGPPTPPSRPRNRASSGGFAARPAEGDTRPRVSVKGAKRFAKSEESSGTRGGGVAALERQPRDGAGGAAVWVPVQALGAPRSGGRSGRTAARRLGTLRGGGGRRRTGRPAGDGVVRASRQPRRRPGRGGVRTPGSEAAARRARPASRDPAGVWGGSVHRPPAQVCPGPGAVLGGSRGHGRTSLPLWLFTWAEGADGRFSQDPARLEGS